MITKLCIKAGCKPKAIDRMVAGTPGPITLSSVKKSRSLSHVGDPVEGARSRPMAQGAIERNDQWFEIMKAKMELITGQQSTITRVQKRIEKGKMANTKIIAMF